MINVEESSRELIVINIRPTRDDPMYMGCLWMTVYVDTAAWRLMVDSDCGSYIYHWPNEDEIHPFRKALAGYLMDESYILRKIGEKDVFDVDRTIGFLEECYSDDPEMLDRIRIAKSEYGLSDASSVDEFVDTCSDNSIDIDPCDDLQFTYSEQAKRVAHLLKEYVAPVLRGKEGTDE